MCRSSKWAVSEFMFRVVIIIDVASPLQTGIGSRGLSDKIVCKALPAFEFSTIFPALKDVKYRKTKTSLY